MPRPTPWATVKIPSLPLIFTQKKGFSQKSFLALGALMWRQKPAGYTYHRVPLASHATSGNLSFPICKTG